MKKKLMRGFSAFSLVELMFILTTLSCMLAAFAPLITKKIENETYTAFSASGLSSMKIDCADEFNSNCLMCEVRNDYKRCIICELECVSSKTLNNDECVCE